MLRGRRRRSNCVRALLIPSTESMPWGRRGGTDDCLSEIRRRDSQQVVWPIESVRKFGETREQEETWGLARESVLTVMTVTSKQVFDGMYEHSRIRVDHKLCRQGDRRMQGGQEEAGWDRDK